MISIYKTSDSYYLPLIHLGEMPSYSRLIDLISCMDHKNNFIAGNLLDF